MRSENHLRQKVGCTCCNSAALVLFVFFKPPRLSLADFCVKYALLSPSPPDDSHGSTDG